MREYSGRLTGFDPSNVCTVKAVREEHCENVILITCYLSTTTRNQIHQDSLLCGGTEKHTFCLSEGLCLYVLLQKKKKKKSMVTAASTELP